MLVRPAHGAVYADLPDEFTLCVGLAMDVGQQAIPGAVPTPADETVVAGLPGTVTFWYVASGSAGSQPPQYAVYDPSVAHHCPPLPPFSSSSGEIRRHAASVSSPRSRKM